MNDRTVVSIFSDGEPIALDPDAVTHIIVLGDDERTASDHKPAEVVAELQSILNTDLWAALRERAMAGAADVIMHLVVTQGAPDAQAMLATLNQLQIPKDQSVFCQAPEVSLDGGQSEQTAFSLIVFKDTEPRLILSALPPKVGETPTGE